MVSHDGAGRSIVLIVEDEPLLRLFAIDMIEDAGFEPLGAANSTEAIAILEARSDIRIVFSDVDMPGGMDGLRLAAFIRDKWPRIQIIITSGKPLPLYFSLPTEVIFFSKPYRQDRVLDTLQRMSHA